MHLRSVMVDGYKRFASNQVLYVGQRVVAIVGPNEAGKTSLLTALRHVTDSSDFERREFTGRQRPDADVKIVSARYDVEPADLEAVSGLVDQNAAYKFELQKWSSSGTRWQMIPWVSRDTTLRTEFRDALVKAAASNEFMITVAPTEEAAEGEEPPEIVVEESVSRAAQDLAALLANADEDLTEAEHQALGEFRSTLSTRREQLPEALAVDELLAELDELERLENLENPRNQLYRSLRPKVPTFLLFDEGQLLLSDYAWTDYAEPPDGLANLLYLADCTFDRYRELATDRERRDELNTYERQLNRKLKEKLEVWSQHELTITLRADTESIAVHVTDQDTDRDVLIEERSAGLQMFAAVLAFCARHDDGVAPILLFDEAETHLHYGAQADLVQVFERQEVAQAVIYTTHSIGCLPEDLGRSIRVVAPVGNEASEIRNNFWSGGVGLTPLTLAMGASALAVLPARYALIGEGPTEAIVLPSLFREAREPRFRGKPLGFQVAPGGAEVSASVAPELENEAGNVAYVFDADDGGRRHAAKLAARAHNEGRVFILGDGAEPGLCTEDFVVSATYLAAVNQILEQTRHVTQRLSASDLPDVGRGAAVDAWCEDNEIDQLSKTQIAEAVLTIAEATGALLEPARKALVAALNRDVRKAVGLK